jgi:sugar phosphate isomerase/epimerase
MPTLSPGVCSVTFRGLPADEVVDLAADGGLAAIEWGGDVHVAPGDTTEAERLRRRCAAHDLTCPSYGSYFFAGQTPPDELDAVVATAEALGASTVRVWAPYGVAPGADPVAVDSIVVALRDACDRAATRGLTLALEFHPDTLTETSESTCALLASVARPNLATYWQPRPGATPDAALAELRAVAPHLAHVHVFAWRRDSTRLPLHERADMWTSALATIAAIAPPADRVAYLEFVVDDDPVAFARDAATLRSWMRELA